MEKSLSIRGIKVFNTAPHGKTRDKESTSSTLAILPVELFNDIFQYFSLREIFRSFFHLTRRLDSFIQSDRIQFRGAYLSNDDRSLPASANTKQVISLKLMNFYHVQLVPSFIHLRSLTIEMESSFNRQKMQHITDALPLLTHLISLQTNVTDFQLIAAAFSHPHLRRFTFISDLYERPPPFPVSHSLRYITVPTLNLSTVGDCLPHARFLDIASFDQSVRPTLICPHLRILHLCVSLMKAIDTCSLLNSNAFPSLEEMKLTGNIDRGAEMTLLQLGESFFPLLYKLRKVTLNLTISGARMIADPTQDKFLKSIEIERERGNWEQLQVDAVKEFPRLWYNLSGFKDKTMKT